MMWIVVLAIILVSCTSLHVEKLVVCADGNVTITISSDTPTTITSPLEVSLMGL